MRTLLTTEPKNKTNIFFSVEIFSDENKKGMKSFVFYRDEKSSFLVLEVWKRYKGKVKFW